MSTERDRSAIIMEAFTSMPTKTFTLKSLASMSGGNDREGRMAVKRIVTSMLEQGVLTSPSSGKFRLSQAHLPRFQGRVSIVSSGDAYVTVPGREQDIYVHRRNTARALNNDLVNVAIIRTNSRSQAEGEITDVVERNPGNYVGVVQKTQNHAFVVVDSRKMPYDIFIPGPNTTLVDGNKVIVHVTDWDENSHSPSGIIVDDLGHSGDNETEMHAILAEYDLPYSFPENVVREAEAIPDGVTPEEIASRRDMRDVVTFTIDPADAKDFDDAVSVCRKGDGLWQVGIHIADVTFYVRDGELEREALQRATSVYLVDRTVPMLPERLSNDLCSLNPHTDKLTFSVVVDIDSDLNVRNSWIGRTVINSDRRFTYEQAQAIIEGADDPLREEVITLNSIAQALRERRFSLGSVAFEREEAKFRLDDDGKPVGVYFKEQKESNQLIEELMLLANRTVAEYVGAADRTRPKESRRTFVYRVHDKPDLEKLMRLSRFAGIFGHRFKVAGMDKVAAEINSLMAKVKGRSEENVLSNMAVRAMAKAFYTTENIGHYGLGFKYYTHFTSPIRRYPDMMVHRLLARYLAGGKSPAAAEWEAMCEHSSDMEVRAAEAERASIRYKMVEFMLDKVGQEFRGSVSGISENGIFVELDDTHIEGMVPIRSLAGDHFQFFQETYTVEGAASDASIGMGDVMTVRVKKADLQHRMLDFELVEAVSLQTGRSLYPVEPMFSQAVPRVKSGGRRSGGKNR